MLSLLSEYCVSTKEISPSTPNAARIQGYWRAYAVLHFILPSRESYSAFPYKRFFVIWASKHYLFLHFHPSSWSNWPNPIQIPHSSSFLMIFLSLSFLVIICLIAREGLKGASPTDLSIHLFSPPISDSGSYMYNFHLVQALFSMHGCPHLTVHESQLVYRSQFSLVWDNMLLI